MEVLSWEARNRLSGQIIRIGTTLRMIASSLSRLDRGLMGLCRGHLLAGRIVKHTLTKYGLGVSILHRCFHSILKHEN